MQISWQVQYFVGLEVQILWQAQYFVNLELQISWQAQYFVDLEVQILWQTAAIAANKKTKPPFNLHFGRQAFLVLQVHCCPSR